MKTDQLMAVCFPAGTLHIGHLTKTGSLTDMFNIGNKMRAAEGKSPANITNFVNSKATQDFITECAEAQGIPREAVVRTVGRGKASRTEANLHLLVYAAQYLSTKFHYQVIDTFINHKILKWRDESGDQFIALNLAIDAHLPGREGKDNKGLFITLAKLLKAKLSPDGDSWNTATCQQLEARAKAERTLVQLLQLGVVRDWEHLKSLIDKI